jgi:hypothetical protein
MDIREKDMFDDYVSGTTRVVIDSNPGAAPPPILPGDTVVASSAVYNSDGTVTLGIDGNLQTQNNLENFRRLDEEFGNGTNRFNPNDLIVNGGPGSTFIGGCTDPTARNYNKNATRDDGSCIYNPPALPVVLDKTNKVVLNLRTEDKRNFTTIVDGRQIPSPENRLIYTEKELLSGRTITVVSSTGDKSQEVYKVKAVQRKINKKIKPVLPLDFDDDVVIRDFEDRIKFSADIDYRPIPETVDYNIELQRQNPGLFRLGGFGNQAIPEIDYNRPTTRPTFGIAPYIPQTTFTKPPITFGNVSFTSYEIVIEKISNGETIKVPIPSQNKDFKNKLGTTTVPLSFSFQRYTPLPRVSLYDIELTGDISTSLPNQFIQYTTSDGQTGIVQNGINKITIAKQQSYGKKRIQPCFIRFESKGISDYTHKVSYQYSNFSEKKLQTITGLEQQISLSVGSNKIKVTASKIGIPPKVDTPNITVENENIIFNIASSDSTQISYKTQYADKVIFTLGTLVRELGSSGTITLKNEDFTNGVGKYTLYLQPVSKRSGSGKLKKVLVNVLSKAYLPGPDITHINYPQNIKGADFKEFDVDFDISWQSINTNYIKIFVGKESDSTLLTKVAKAGKQKLNVSQILRLAGETLDIDRDVTVFKLLFIPYNEEGDELTAGKTEEVKITFDKGDLRLRRGKVLNDFKNAFLSNADDSEFDDFISPLLTHYLHTGDGDNKLISTWGIDDITFSEQYRDENTNEIKYRNVEKSLVLKLYEPLPRDIQPNDTVWLSKVHSIPLIDEITIIDDISSKCTPLRPNFELEVGDAIGYQILDDLISSGSTSSTEVVNEFVSSSNFSLENLNINFISSSTSYVDDILVDGNVDYNWKDFVKYSSAVERVENFYYKIKLINTYDTKYNSLTTGTDWTGSVAVTNEAKTQLKKINDVKKGFDAFEKFLYESSSADGFPYPKTNNTGSIIHPLSSSALDWYNGAIDSAETYDELNTSRLTYNLPQHIKDDSNNSDFILFFDMVGQHFDVLWTHIKGTSQSKKLEHKYESGITNDLIYHMLESLGFNADMGAQSQFLWEYAFGKHSDGTVVSEMSGKDRQQEIWRRILNNLPYLYKHKGTKRALHAAMSCYGIPQSLLTVMEFGGPKDVTKSGTTKYTFEDRTASINVSGSSAIRVPWKQFSNTLSTDYPNSVEVRLNTDQRQDQEILSGSDWSLHLLKDTGSLGKLELRVSGSGTLYSASSDTAPLFNDGYTQIVVNKDTDGSDDVFTFYAKEGFQERIRTNVSGSLTVTGGSDWTNGNYIKLGGTSLTASVDEFRLWRTPLSESRVDNHTLFPDAIDGNHISASTHDLIFRNDFEYPKNRHTSGDVDIKNVALVTTYCTSSVAISFENDTTYPYQYTPYNRDVTATVPSTGFSFGNKVRFETQTKILDLSYRTRATKKSFDQSPVDSNRLGLFFSPIKEINLDILKGLGEFEIDNYIGNPSDEYSEEYRDLRTLRNYYFDRFSLNFQEYIQLVRYIDKSLFETLESLVPHRAATSSGLLIEPHILERSKTKWNRPTSLKGDYETSINVEEDVNLSTEKPTYTTTIDAEADVNLVGTTPFYSTSIDAETDVNLVGTAPFYSSSIDAESDVNLFGSITRDKDSTMGGIVFNIDAKITGSLSGMYDSSKYEQIGMDPDGLSRLGFGLYASASHSNRTYIDVYGNVVKERVKIFLINQSYTEDVPKNINSNDSSLGTELETVTKYRKKVTILPFTGSDGLETSTPSGGDIVSATPLDGYFPTHYRNVGDLTSGMENSFHNGSRQTSATTTDGGSPVQIFTTNPNTLRVSDSGRGSGEPILEVD